MQLAKLIIVAVLGMFLGNLQAGGFVAINDAQVQWLPEHSRSVTVNIKDFSARTVVEQEFRNTTSRRLEGTFLFPVPKGAAIEKFSMFINGKEMPAELLEAGKARSIYEEIVRKQQDPALFEYLGQDVFKIRIFPIEPNEIKKIKFSYVQSIQPDAGVFSYSYPVTKGDKKESVVIKGKMVIESTDPLSHLSCSFSSAKIEREGVFKALVNWEVKSTDEVSVISLDYMTKRKDPALFVSSYRVPGEEGFFQLNLIPSSIPTDITPISKEIVFVLDTSGSMAGEKLQQAKKALLYCLRTLPKDDKFDVIRFSTEAEALFGDLKTSHPENLKLAEKFIDSFQAAGGTHISEALELALKGGGADSKNRIILFITDGKPTIGEKDPDKILSIVKQRSSTTRIFTFGVGYDLNVKLLDKIAEETKAARTYVSANEDIEIKVSSLFTKIKSPILTGLTLKFEGSPRISKTYPFLNQLPDLFSGSSLELTGLYSESGKVKAVLEGFLNEKKMRYEYDISFPEKESFNQQIPLQWAMKRVAWLLDKIRLHGSDQELVDETVHLARKYGIVTPYTSWLILEDEQQVPVPVDPRFIKRGISPSRMEESKKAKQDMFSESGAGSVQASREIDDLRQSKSVASDKNVKDFSEKRIVKGKVFHYINSVWIDSELRNKNNLPKVTLKYGSDTYYRFIKENEELSPFLALGKQVEFIFEGKHYLVTIE